MPGLLRKDEPAEIPGAIAVIGDEQNDNIENEMPHPQPTSLQGLLRFALNATGAEDAPGPSVLGPMDEERKKFLEDALKSMTIDVVELLLKQIKVFEDVDAVTADSDVTEYTEACAIILDYIDDIDIANDFHKIGGFTILKPCLQCPHSGIRKGACDIITALCQNNPYCQKIFNENDFVSHIVSLTLEDRDDISVHAVSALSSIVRDNIDGYRQFLRNFGLNVLLDVITRNNDRLRTKIAFFLNSLFQLDNNLKEKLTGLGFVNVLMSSISEELLPSHEHILYLLKNIVDGNDAAKRICQDPQHNFEHVLRNTLDLTKDKEEFQEEYDYSQYLLDYLFPGPSS